nr:Zn-ribbon domain-containing OB-fold protein [Candidatus Sigynarchaeota archaeon]
MEYKKPLPTPTPISKKYWEAAREHKLMIQKCGDCGENVFYPRAFCPKCMSSNLNWIESSGKGKLHSFCVVYSTGYPEFREDVPFIIALVELEEGVHMLSNLVECKPEDAQVDMDVEVVFDDVTEEFSLPKFRPLKSG